MEVMLRIEENNVMRCGDAYVIVTRSGTGSSRAIEHALTKLAEEYRAQRHPTVNPSSCSGMSDTPSTEESRNQTSAMGLPSR